MAITNKNTDLEDDGLSLQLRPSFEYGIDDLEELFPLQDAGIVFLEVLDEIVQDKVRPWEVILFLFRVH